MTNLQILTNESRKSLTQRVWDEEESNNQIPKILRCQTFRNALDLHSMTTTEGRSVDNK